MAPGRRIEYCGYLLLVALAKSKLDQLKQDARKEAASVVGPLEQGELPVDLNTLAQSESVGAIRFRPILGTAGLLKVGDGYEIVINTEAPGASVAPETVFQVGQTNWSNFAPPIRFAIAHEIIHLIILRVSGGDPNKDIFTRNEEALDHLSNELAASLLMPAGRLVAEIGENLLSPDHLVRVTRAFSVSPEALARRLASTDVRRRFKNVDGLVGYMREQVGDGDTAARGVRFVAGHIWGVPARHQFGIGEKRAGELFESSEFPSGRSLADMRLDPDPTDALRTENSGSRSANAIWRKGPPRKVLRCEVQFCRTSQKPFGLFLAIQVLEGPLEG